MTDTFKALLLNRAHAYSTPRTPLRLNWQTRLFLRIGPTVFLINEVFQILFAMKCQIGSQLPELRLSSTNRVLNRSWGHANGGFLHRFISAILFWETDIGCCKKINMVPVNDDPLSFYGSTSLLWPLFLTLGFSQLMETISSALQGRRPFAETGMTIFEHSLAFSEAETVVRTAAGIGLFGLSSSPLAGNTKSDNHATGVPKGRIVSLSRSMILARLNVPPEILMISLLSCASHLTSQTLGVLGLQSKYRLISTSVWGLSFIILLIHSFFTFASSNRIEDMQIARYPTVCIAGFVPHVLIMVGMLACGLMYIVAIVATVLSPPPPIASERGFWSRIKLAHRNLQATSAVTNIVFLMDEDFYTFILKAGYTVLSAAAEAVYFNEEISVSMAAHTWLDRGRGEELAKSMWTQNAPARIPGAKIPVELHGDMTGNEGFGLVDAEPGLDSNGSRLHSGYAKERKTTKEVNRDATKEAGVGIDQRSARWSTSARFAQEAVDLLSYWWARFTISMIQRSRTSSSAPEWLKNMARLSEDTKSGQGLGEKPAVKDFWLVSASGKTSVPQTLRIDVEAELRKRYNRSGTKVDLDDELYNWWRSNGWWGESDSSGAFRPPSEIDDDLTSVVSDTTARESESFTSTPRGSRDVTPTQENFGMHHVDENTTARIAELLDPKTLEDKEEARMLSHHLRGTGPMTRSQFRRRLFADKTRILTGTPLNGAQPDLTDEETVLEQIILSRRTSTASPQLRQSWRDGGQGVGFGGPDCAVCHCEPRTILVWPCRCLSLCDSCRETLAMKNFGTCVCCRRDVVSYSRLFVP